MKRAHRLALARLMIFAAIVGLVATWGWLAMIRMPGESYRGPMPPLTEEQTELRDALRQDVEKLAGDIGERNYWLHENLSAAADFIDASLSAAGYQVRRHACEVQDKVCYNIDAAIDGTTHAGEIVIVGAHYDSVLGSPGANDNGSAVAAMLALARRFVGQKPDRTLRFVAFTNEEPPFFKTDDMGSFIYARECRQRREQIVAMLSLETIGYYTDTEGSQHYPFPFSYFYPSTGNFIGFVGNISSRKLVREVIGSFRRHAKFPSEGAAFPAFITGVDWSDQWSFWQQGFSALMVTDTAPFRYHYYHSPLDTPDKLDYDGLARVVAGLEKVVADLVGIRE